MLIAFITLFCLGYFLRKQRTEDAIAGAIVGWNILSFTGTELLSAFRFLETKGVLLWWLGIDLILLFLLLSNLKKVNVACKESEPNIKKMKLKQNWILFLPCAIVVILAFLTVPYNWDSMTYHLPRILHWVQNRSVAHYATNDIRQISSPVLAEFINTQVYLLTGRRDCFFNLLQAGSFIASGYYVYKIAEKIGCHRKYAVLGTMLFLTMPIAFAEALSTQVDVFATVWMLLFVYYYIDIYEEEHIAADRRTMRKCLIMAVCVAFGYLTKPSVDIGMAVLLVGLLVRCIRKRDKIQELLKILFPAALIILVILLPESVRMIQTFHALGEPTAGKRQLIGTLKPNYVFINMLKNFAQNWPNIYLHDSEEWMAKIVMIAAAALRVDINDPAIAEDGMEYVMNMPPAYGQDTAINPIVMILSFLCFLIAIICHKKDRTAGHRYTLAFMGIFIIFCAMVRWECYVTRYMISYLALLCPAIGYQIQNVSEKFQTRILKTALYPVVWFLCFTELFSLTWYHQEKWHESAMQRPIGYFANNGGIRLEYEETLSCLRELGCQKVGIKLNGVNYEYPIWWMLKENDIEIRHILVENASGIYEDETYIPEYIILENGIADGHITVHGQEYHELEEFVDNQYIKVYRKRS